ncbi:MAG: hypothetical protein ACR2RE_04330 [Geminicoccaceae bacterium]
MKLSTLTLDQAWEMKAGDECCILIAHAIGEVVEIGASDDIHVHDELLARGGSVVVVYADGSRQVQRLRPSSSWIVENGRRVFFDAIIPWCPDTDANAAIEAFLSFVKNLDIEWIDWEIGPAWDYSQEKRRPCFRANVGWSSSENGFAPAFPLALCRAILVRHVEAQ